MDKKIAMISKRGFASRNPECLPEVRRSKSSKDITHWLSRRDFLQWVGAITALLGSEACMPEPLHKILPYSKAPEEIIPGMPNWYATTVVMGGAATGLLLKATRDVRPKSKAILPSR